MKYIISIVFLLMILGCNKPSDNNDEKTNQIIYEDIIITTTNYKPIKIFEFDDEKWGGKNNYYNISYFTNTNGVFFIRPKFYSNIILPIYKIFMSNNIITLKHIGNKLLDNSLYHIIGNNNTEINTNQIYLYIKSNIIKDCENLSIGNFFKSNFGVFNLLIDIYNRKYDNMTVPSIIAIYENNKFRRINTQINGRRVYLYNIGDNIIQYIEERNALLFIGFYEDRFENSRIFLYSINDDKTYDLTKIDKRFAYDTPYIIPNTDYLIYSEDGIMVKKIELN